METKIYKTKKKYVTANGEVRYHDNSTIYKPVDKINKIKKDDIIKSIRNIKDKNKLKKIKELIDELNKE